MAKPCFTVETMSVPIYKSKKDKKMIAHVEVAANAPVEKVQEEIVASGEHSTEWWEGYGCLGPVVLNPYKSGASEKSLDWIDGWHCRFHAEQP